MRLALLLTLSMLSPVAAGGQELVERTLAIVGRAAITLSDVRTAMALGLVDTNDEATAIEALVQRALVLQEVDRYAPPEPGNAVPHLLHRLAPAQQNPADLGLRVRGLRRGCRRDP